MELSDSEEPVAVQRSKSLDIHKLTQKKKRAPQTRSHERALSHDAKDSAKEKRLSRSFFRLLRRTSSSKKLSQSSDGSSTPTKSRRRTRSSSLKAECGKKKKKKHNFLIRFFLSRPAKKNLIDKGIIPADAREAGAEKNNWFGVPLRELYETNHMFGVAPVVTYCIQHLQPYLDKEGLFRVSGTFREMDSMKLCFEEGREPDLNEVENIHSIAGLLELYLRELPEPPLTYALYDTFLACVDQPQATQLLALQAVCNKLPPPNYSLLEVLLPFLREVTLHSDNNKMTVSNMGMVFGPVLLGTAALTMLLEDVSKIKKQNTLIKELITNADLLFGTYVDTRQAAESETGANNDCSKEEKKEIGGVTKNSPSTNETSSTAKPTQVPSEKTKSASKGKASKKKG